MSHLCDCDERLVLIVFSCPNILPATFCQILCFRLAKSPLSKVFGFEACVDVFIDLVSCTLKCCCHCGAVPPVLQLYLGEVIDDVLLLHHL